MSSFLSGVLRRAPSVPISSAVLSILRPSFTRMFSTDIMKRDISKSSHRPAYFDNQVGAILRENVSNFHEVTDVLLMI